MATGDAGPRATHRAQSPLQHQRGRNIHELPCAAHQGRVLRRCRRALRCRGCRCHSDACLRRLLRHLHRHHEHHRPSGAVATLPARDKCIHSCQLSKGNTGSGVKALQRTLNLCYSAGLDTDGVFGDKTRSALISAQKKAGTTADGIYGPNTRDAIKWPWWTEANHSCYKRP